MKKIADGPFVGMLENYYRVLLVDPPWHFSGGVKGRPQHYARMRDSEIAAMPVGALAHPEGCWLFLWCTSAKVESVFKVAKAWGFAYSGRGFVWVKTNKRAQASIITAPGGFSLDMMPLLFTGTGFTTRKNVEDCWLFRRGKPVRQSRKVHEVIFAPRREHSRKPDEQYARIQQYAKGPYLELFARQERPGWTAFGNQKDRFASPPLTEGKRAIHDRNMQQVRT